MQRRKAVSFGMLMLCLGCSATPDRLPVRPEPSPLRGNAECYELGLPDLPVSSRPTSSPYGWSLLRFDVDRGQVVNVRIVDSSPEKTFDAETIAYFQKMQYPSRRSAQGCFWSHKWG